MAERITTSKTWDEETLRARREQAEREEDARRAKYPSAWMDPHYYADPRNAYASASIMSPGQENEALTLAGWQRQQIAAQASMLDDEAFSMVERYLDRGYVAPGTAASLAQVARTLKLPDEILSELAEMDATVAASEDSEVLGDRKAKEGSPAEKGGLAKSLGGITRPLFALLSTPVEAVQGTIRSTVGAFQGEGFRNPLAQTTGGQWLAGADLGEGWFPNGEARARHEMAAREAAPEVGGEIWTLGRGLGSLFYDDPESLEYRMTSGIIDLTAAVALDPLVLTGTGAAGARAAARGERAAGAGVTARRAEAAAGEKALRAPEGWLDETDFEAARDYVRQATKDVTAAARRSGEGAAADAVSMASSRFDRVVDTLEEARSNASAASRRPQASETAARQAGQRVARLRNSIGDDVMAAQASRAAKEAPDLPGNFTVEIPARGSTLPGASDGVDAVVTVGKRDLLKSVDDAIDNPADIANAMRLGKGVSEARTNALRKLREAAKEEGATYGKLIQQAEKDRLGTSLMLALRENGVDGVTDVFRLKNGQGGVWWVHADTDVVKWVDGRWQHVDSSLDAAQTRIRDLDRIRKTTQAERDAALRQVAQRGGAAEDLARQYSAAMDGLTDVANSPAAVRQAVEYSMGVRRQIGGKPVVSHDLIKEWWFGTPKSFDKAIGGTKTAKQKAIVGADRALIGFSTLGASEAIRGIGKAVKPFAAMARQKVLDDLVRLGDTPENLGKLQRLTNGKVPSSILRAALRATDEDGVIESLAPQMGIAADRPFGANVLQAGRARVSEVRMGRSGTWLFNRAARFIERQASITPRGVVTMNFADPEGSAQVLRNYLANVPKLPTEVADGIVGKYLAAGGETGRQRALKNGFDKITDTLVENTAPAGTSSVTRSAISEKLKDATRLYDGGRAQVNTWWAKRYAADANIGVTLQNGERVPLPGPQLEAELARGGVALPDMPELKRAISRWSRTLDKAPGDFAEKVVDWSNYLNDIWRSSILLRPAYVARNVGEMQSRMFLAGMSNIFSHPLQVLGFAAGASVKSGPGRNLMARFSKYNETATGTRFENPTVDDLKDLDETQTHFTEALSRTGSRMDMRTRRNMTAFHGLEEVSVGQPGFTAGLADQLMTLHGSRLTRVVAGYDPEPVARAVAAGQDRKTAIVDWVLNSDGAKGLRADFSDGDSSFAKIFGNPRTNTPGDPQAMRQYLFDTPTSIEARVRYFTGGDDDLAAFVATGQLRRGDEVLFDKLIDTNDAVKYQQAMELRTKNLAKAIRPFVDQLPNDQKLFMRVARSRGSEMDRQGMLDTVFDRFFHWSGRMENALAVGPEFAFRYHQKLAEMLPSLEKGSRQQVFDVIRNAEGVTRRRSETMLAARAGLKSKQEGFLNIDDVSRVAAKEASDHVKTFFYDAMQRRQIFHAMRMVAPFAQSFADTLYKWGSLAAKRPYMMEKVGRLGIALEEEGSGTIYDAFEWIDPWQNQSRRDPTQGFLFKDPQTGEQNFAFPLVGSVLGSLMSPMAGMNPLPGQDNLATGQMLTAPLKNLNIALQGDVDYLPGLGPLFTLPAAGIMPDDWFGGVPEWIQSWLFPYGRPDLEGGVVESVFLPSWARRLTGVFYNDDFRAYSLKGSLAWELSNREYDLGDPAEIERLKSNTTRTAKMMTAIRAFGAAVLPAAPDNEIFAQDEDGRLIGVTYLSDRYQHLLDDHAGDTEAATQDLIDTYGLDAIAAIVPASEGELSFSGEAWQFYKDTPTAKPFADTIGAFFPGDSSIEAYSFQIDAGARRKLSASERADKAVEYLYNAEKAALEAQAAEQDWDPDTLDGHEEDLKRRYGNVIPTFTGTTISDRIDKARRALDNLPELAGTRGGQGATLLFEAYDAHIAQAEERWGKGATLASQRAQELRESFLFEMAQINDQFGGQHPDGSTDTIARWFERQVRPRSE